MRINYDADQMNGTVLIACDLHERPQEVHVGMNGVVIVGSNAAEVCQMYDKYLAAKAEKEQAWRH